MSKSLKWYGDELIAALSKAQKAGINQTMSDCVVHAVNNHPWQNQTGVLEGSLDVAEPAARVDNGFSGRWGSLDNNYALAMELGATIAHPGGTAYYIDESGKAVFVSNREAHSEGLPRTKPHTIVIKPHPFLRPAADACYPRLAGKIRESFARQTGLKTKQESGD